LVIDRSGGFVGVKGLIGDIPWGVGYRYE